MIEEKQTLVIAREWTNPQIHVWISEETIGMRMSAEDYLKALAEEIGNPTMLVTKAALLEKLQQANSRIISSMKNYSTSVV